VQGLGFSRKDGRQFIAAYAASAAILAKQAPTQRDRDTWEKIAEFWLDLERMKADVPFKFGNRLPLPPNLKSAQSYGASSGRVQFSTVITCQGCGQEGAESWEIGGKTANDNLDIQFVARLGDFYERISETPPFPIEVVCQRCGKVMSD
jgi:hypothetical protein